MGTKEHRYISCDTHIYEPADLWTSRMRGKFADKAPYLDSRPEGDYYMIDGVDPQPCGSAGANLQQKIEKGEVGWRPARHEGQDGARKEAGDPQLRLKDQELDNVRAEIIYPNQWELNIYNAPDAEYAQTCAQIYNDWLAEFLRCRSGPIDRSRRPHDQGTHRVVDRRGEAGCENGFQDGPHPGGQCRAPLRGSRLLRGVLGHTSGPRLGRGYPHHEHYDQQVAPGELSARHSARGHTCS